MEIWTFQDFLHIKTLGIKIDLAVKQITVNPESSFVQTM